MSYFDYGSGGDIFRDETSDVALHANAIDSKVVFLLLRCLVRGISVNAEILEEFEKQIGQSCVILQTDDGVEALAKMLSLQYIGLAKEDLGE